MPVEYRRPGGVSLFDRRHDADFNPLSGVSAAAGGGPAVMRGLRVMAQKRRAKCKLAARPTESRPCPRELQRRLWSARNPHRGRDVLAHPLDDRRGMVSPGFSTADAALGSVLQSRRVAVSCPVGFGFSDGCYISGTTSLALRSLGMVRPARSIHLGAGVGWSPSGRHERPALMDRWVG